MTKVKVSALLGIEAIQRKGKRLRKDSSCRKIRKIYLTLCPFQSISLKSSDFLFHNVCPVRQDLYIKGKEK